MIQSQYDSKSISTGKHCKNAFGHHECETFDLYWYYQLPKQTDATCGGLGGMSGMDFGNGMMGGDLNLSGLEGDMSLAGLSGPDMGMSLSSTDENWVA